MDKSPQEMVREFFTASGWTLAGTETGRMSGAKINLHELPKAQGAHMTDQEDYEAHRAELQEYFSKNQDTIDVSIGNLAKAINGWMRAQGFWESRNKGEKIALIHSELSECLEAIRKGDAENEEEELADAIIRIFDYAGEHGMNLGAALCEKMQKNLLRPRKHGKAF